MAKISVIIPVYNVEKFLNRCIESVINQDFTEIEIIMVNDGSTDKSGKICKRYANEDGRIKFFSKENGGLSSAINYGLDKATGKYIYFLDSDDFLHKNAFSEMVRIMEQTKTDIVSTNLRLVSENPELNIENDYVNAYFEVATNKVFFLQNISNHACGKLYKRNLFEGIRYPEGRNYEDISTTYRLYKKANKIAYSKDSLYFYRQRNNAITQTITKKNINDLLLAYKDVKSDLFNTNELYNYYLLTILYILYSRALRMSKKEKIYAKQMVKYINDEMKLYGSLANIKKYKSESDMYNKLLLLKLHLVKPVVNIVDLYRKYRGR